MHIKNLSYSKIATLLRCPRLFEYQYIERIPSVLHGRMVAGRCYHHALAVAESRKHLFNELITDEQVAESVTRQWTYELRDRWVYDELGEERVEATIVDFGDDNPGQLKDTTIKLAQLFVSTILPNLNIVGIEKRMATTVEGIPFISYLDLELVGNVVADHKLSRRKMSENEIGKDIQASSYAMQVGKPIDFRWYQALDVKDRRIEILETRRGTAEIEWFKRLVVAVWQQIQSGIFPPNPLSWLCGPDCSYNLECQHPDL